MEQIAPEISVVMAVYNGERYLKDTMDSILSQSFSSFELIVINDASTDSTPELLQEYAASDDRVKVYTNATNLRLANSLNRGIELAGGKYILRMDADDICLKDRFEKQYRYMETHPEVDLSYCKFFAMYENKLIPCGLSRKCDYDSIKAMFLFFDPVLHPGVIVKSSVMKKYRYDPLHTCSEDLDLWTRMLVDGVKMTSSGDFLMLYRIHASSITAKTKDKQALEVLESEKIFYQNTLFSLSDEEAEFFTHYVYFRDQFDMQKLYHFYRKIVKANRKTKAFSKSAVVEAIVEILAEYNRDGKLGFAQKISMLRFGGVRFVKAFIARKKNSRKDMELAALTASKNRFIASPHEDAVPIYYISKA